VPYLEGMDIHGLSRIVCNLNLDVNGGQMPFIITIKGKPNKRYGIKFFEKSII